MFVSVNPFSIRPGDHIRTNNGKTREVKRVNVDGCTPECIHLDQECYDPRFTFVDLKTK